MHNKDPQRVQTHKFSKLDLPQFSPNLSQSVLAVSEMYLQRAPRLNELWRNENLAHAYVAYYMPLNWLRALAVIAEGSARGFFQDLAHAIDFGSGPGTFHLAALESGLLFKSWTFIEHEKAAQEWHRRFLDSDDDLSWVREYSPSAAPTKNTLGIFSYSLNELGLLPEWAFDLEALCLIEPSDAQAGRRLQELRQTLLDRGFSIWAPCTHHEKCPLLTHSKTDWCHQRIHVELPESVAALEKHLPMKNATLTYSYLLARRRKPALQTRARVIGDTLHERGKVRQAVCRGPAREFLSWLTRHGEPEPIPRGTLIELPESIEIKGNEIRLSRK